MSSRLGPVSSRPSGRSGRGERFSGQRSFGSVVELVVPSQLSMLSVAAVCLYC